MTHESAMTQHGRVIISLNQEEEERGEQFLSHFDYDESRTWWWRVMSCVSLQRLRLCQRPKALCEPAKRPPRTPTRFKADVVVTELMCRVGQQQKLIGAVADAFCSASRWMLRHRRSVFLQADCCCFRCFTNLQNARTAPLLHYFLRLQ